MRNMYADTCYRCGKIVKAGEGHFERVSKQIFKKYGWQSKKWITQHADCAIKYRGTEAGEK
jgi:hypothetical protein